MCEAKKCPLQSMCEVYEATADVLKEENVRIASEQYDEALLRVEQDDSLESVSEMLAGARDVLRAHSDAMRESLRSSERYIEAIQCTGRIVVRKYGVFGKIISETCGSEERRQRLGEA